MAITDSTNPNDTPATPNTTPIVGDLDLSLDLPPVVAQTPAADTDRLKEEDISTQKVETPVEVLAASSLASNEKSAEIIQENLPQSAKEMTLQDDMKIIQDIQNVEPIKTEPQERILETKKIDPMMETPAAVQTPIAVETQSSTMNLDSLLGAPTPPVAPIEQVKNPFDLIQSNTPTIVPAPSATANQINNSSAILGANAQALKTRGVKIGLFVVLFVALGFFTYFIISTMYPMGFFASNTTGQTIITETTGNILSGEILTGTEIVAMTTGATIDTGHSSANDANFQDINSLITDTTTTSTTTPSANAALSQEAIVVKLNNYQELGAKYLQASKTQNDLQGMKRSLYLTKKAPELLNKIIANTSAIDTMQEEITTQLAQFETFLQQLQTKYGDLSATSIQTPTDFITSE